MAFTPPDRINRFPINDVNDQSLSTPKSTPEEKKIQIEQSKFVPSHNSFSGADIRALIAMPAADGRDPIYKVFASIQTLTYSIYREKAPVRSLGFIGERGKTRGPRTIAGSMVFTVFDRHALWDVMRTKPGDNSKDSISSVGGLKELSYVLADQLPPFDIVVHFANEYGYTSELVIFGVEIASEGQVMSIQDMITENTVQYTAQHISVMKPGGFKSAIATNPTQGKNFESIMNGSRSKDLQELIDRSSNPFR